MRISKQRKILNQISALRDSHPQMVNIFRYGSCLNLFCILKLIYPEAEAYYNQDHIVTKIDKSFYDISGRVLDRNYRPFTGFYNKRRTSRAFTQMYNAEFSLIPKDYEAIKTIYR